MGDKNLEGDSDGLSDLMSKVNLQDETENAEKEKTRKLLDAKASTGGEILTKEELKGLMAKAVIPK